MSKVAEFESAVLKALGLEQSKVVKIIITMEALQPPTAEATLLVPSNTDIRGFVEQVRKFTLSEGESEGDEAQEPFDFT